MLIRSPENVDARPMQMPGASGVRMRLMVGRDDGAPNFAMRVFEVEPGGHTPQHQHDYEHEILVLEGEGQLVDQDNQTQPIRAGDAVYVPANELHQFQNASDRPLKFLCMVPTTFDCGKPTPGSF